MGNCKNCDREYIESKDCPWGFCRRSDCREAQSNWASENFDQLPEGKLRSQHENAFYVLTDVQREHYKTHQSLIRTPCTMTTGRKCIKCRKSMGRQMVGDNHRICGVCHTLNRNVGELGYRTPHKVQLAKQSIEYNIMR